MHRITHVDVGRDYRLTLTFDDGTTGTADLSDLVGKGVFEAWQDHDRFAQVQVGQAGELIWPGGLDLCPDALYLRVTGRKPEDVFPQLNREASRA